MMQREYEGTGAETEAKDDEDREPPIARAIVALFR
jgi:hypothetical protein